MVKVQINDRSVYYDGYLKTNLDIAKDVIKKDWDMCFVVDGVEGTGKSVLAQQCAYFLDPTLTIDRITFNPREFRDAIIKAGKYQAVVYDEAYGGLASRQAMSQVNKALVSMMAQIRQKNLYVFIVLPCFFELDKYIALWRSRALIHVYTGEKFQRGYFSFFNIEKKKQLYVLGKKFYNYLVKPNFRGRFAKGYVVDEEAYRKKKLKALEEDDLDVDDSFKSQRNSLIRVLYERKWEQQEIAEAVNKYSGTTMQANGISKVINRAIKLEGERKNEIATNE